MEQLFDATCGTNIAPGELEHIWRGERGLHIDRSPPGRAHAWYCVGIDWAQKRDYTVAAVLRCDVTPLQLVAVHRTQRRPWPEMTERVGALLDAFPGPAAHDATGAGSAIGAFPALEAGAKGILAQPPPNRRPADLRDQPLCDHFALQLAHGPPRERHTPLGGEFTRQGLDSDDETGGESGRDARPGAAHRARAGGGRRSACATC